MRTLERSGVPRSTAMAMVGHKTESIYRRYAIVDEAIHREAAAKLGYVERRAAGQGRRRAQGKGAAVQEAKGRLGVSNVFTESCADIEAAYVRLGHTLGWQFLTSPQATLSRDCQIAFITMNPGGSIERPDHGRECSEAGSAYIVEAWKHGYAPGQAPLQVQVRRMFKLLADAQGGRMTGDELLNTSLAGYFVPFRSPQFKALATRASR